MDIFCGQLIDYLAMPMVSAVPGTLRNTAGYMYALSGRNILLVIKQSLPIINKKHVYAVMRAVYGSAGKNYGMSLRH